MPLVLSPPPPTPIEPVTELMHGVPITDSYRWLEDQTSPRTRKWLEEQTAYARAYLDAIPGREKIRKRVEELLAVETISEPWKVGGRYFFLKRRAREAQPTIMMREGAAGDDIPLIDPARMEGSAHVSLSILGISQNGKWLAYGLRASGQDSLFVKFLNIPRRQVLPDRLPQGLLRGLTFSSNDRGIYYSHTALDTSHHSPHAAYWHEFGKPLEEDVEMFRATTPGAICLLLIGSPDDERLLYVVVSMKEKLTNDVYVQELATTGPPRRILDGINGTFWPRLIGKQLVALTDLDAPNCRVVAIDLDHSQPGEWCEIVRESEVRIEDFRIANDLVFVSYVKDFSRRIGIFDMLGNERGTIESPSGGTTRLFVCEPYSEAVFCKSTSFAHPPTIISYDTQTQQQEVFARNTRPIDPTSIESQQFWYPSQDGTQIPLFLVSKKGQVRSTPRPTFLTGYGGFGLSLTPQFTAYGTYLIERGCLFAVANLRGGAEFGEQWHEAGKRRNRQNAITDFISAAEWLLAEGHTAPGRLAIGGGSNAGLLVASAATQRPDLFRAVICLGPLLDMLRYDQFDCANLWLEEYGSPQDPGDFPFLRAYSPYHRVEDGRFYPAFLIISGDADTRCNPMHARKMTARLQAASSSHNPVLLDYKEQWGHLPVQPLSTRIEALTDRLAFLCHEMGITVLERE